MHQAHAYYYGLAPGQPTRMGFAHRRDFERLLNEGSITALAFTQQGSKFLQAKLAGQGGAEARDFILRNTIAEAAQGEIPIGEMLVHAFGNYFIQALFFSCDKTGRRDLLEGICDRIFDVSTNKIGTFAFQRIIEEINDADHATQVRCAQGTPTTCGVPS